MPGPSGAPGRDGLPGSKVERGDTGLPGPPRPAGPSSGGAVHTGWGRITYPNIKGTQLVYHRRAGRTYYNHKRGGGNYQCMPNDHEYSTFLEGKQNQYSYMYGVEYGHSLSSGLHDHNVPCAVCYASMRDSVVMIPAKLSCPSGWTKEYYEYLMSENHLHNIATFECVDANPESVPGSPSDTQGGILKPVEASCNGMPCPPYHPAKELTCVVRSK